MEAKITIRIKTVIDAPKAPAMLYYCVANISRQKFPMRWIAVFVQCSDHDSDHDSDLTHREFLSGNACHTIALVAIGMVLWCVLTCLNGR